MHYNHPPWLEKFLKFNSLKLLKMDYTLFFIRIYTVYKNIEIYQKIKNMLRIFKAEISKNVKNIEPQV